MKKFYSVKETAKLLGVSTNTVYKYVDQGSLQVRRLGRGRIKILYSSLSSIVDLPAQVESVVSPKTSVAPQPFQNRESQSETLRFGVNDIFFFRMFRGLVLLGLGFIYLVDRGITNSFSETLAAQTAGFLFTLMPYVLIFAGIVSVLFDFHKKSSTSSRMLVHIFNSLVFCYFIYTAWIVGMYGQIVFIAPLAILAITHIARGIFPSRQSNFYDEFLRYVLFLALFGGALIVSSSAFFPIPTLRDWVGMNNNLFALMWFFLFIPPLTYFLSPYGRKSGWLLPFFIVWIVCTLVIATKMTIYAQWDIAYMSYLTATFAIFFVFWFYLKQEIEFEKLYLFIALFGWIGLSLVLGLGSVKTSQSQLLVTTRNEADHTLSETASQINSVFKNQKGVLVEYAGSPEVLSYLKSENKDGLSQYAKYIFERTQPASRVVIYNADGIGMGVYPASSLTMGADYSSREYFVITKSTYKGYITPVFESILGTDVVLQSEPIFENNKFVGMIGIAVNLDTFARYFNPVVPPGAKVYIADENGVAVYSSNQEYLGKRLDFLSNAVNTNGPQDIVTKRPINIPRWEVFEIVPSVPVLESISNLNVNLTILFLFNILISIGSGFVATSQRKYVPQSVGSLSALS